jgi:uncharacterized membrane protein
MSENKEILEVEVISAEEAEKTGSNRSPREVKDPKIEKNKTWAALGYLFFLIPLIADFESKFNRFHANQSILLLIYIAIVNALFIIPWIGWLFGVLGWILAIGLFLFGIITAYHGKTWRLPIIGEFDIIDSSKDKVNF